MTIDELLALHDRLCSEAKQIMAKKNHDYTSGSADPFANFRASAAIGVHPTLSILVRVVDKLKRIQTFAERGELQVDREGLDDACIDVINYMVLLRGLLSETERNED